MSSCHAIIVLPQSWSSPGHIVRQDMRTQACIVGEHRCVDELMRTCELHHRLKELKTRVEKAELQLQELDNVAPHVTSSHVSQDELETMYGVLPVTGQPPLERSLPAAMLRFTHRSVNASFAFGDGHGNAQESIYKLHFQLFQGQVQPSELDPLHVFLHCGPDGQWGLVSRNNRRLAALQMLQALRRDETIMVPCYIYRDDATGPSPVEHQSLSQWFRAGYDPPGVDCNGLGLSLQPRAGPNSGRAAHRGYPVFNPAQTVQRALGRALRRERDDGHAQMLQNVVDRLHSVARDGDEETLSFFSGDVPAPQRDGRPGKGKGSFKGKRLGHGKGHNY